MQRFGQFLPQAQRIRLGWPRKQGTEFRKAPSYTALYNLLTQLDLHARGLSACQRFAGVLQSLRC